MGLPKSLIIPCSAPVNSQIRIPGSKSLTNRAVLIASLAQGTTVLDGVLYSDDTRFMIQVCKQLGIQFEKIEEKLEIKGCNGNLLPCNNELYIENAGTAARFLTAVLTLGKGEYTLTGNKRMQQRPIKDLLDGLRVLGGDVKDINGTGCPPIRISAGGMSGGIVSVPGDKSSQYISAIMLTAPYAKSETMIQITGDLVSRSYVEMTRKIMQSFKVKCDWVGDKNLRIEPNQRYKGQVYNIEGDASSASYFFGMAAITRGRIKVTGLKPDSTQGDLQLLDILSKMGCRVDWQEDGVVVTGAKMRGVEVDMNSMSDVAPTLAVIALFAEGETRINNVANMRIKECDRIHAMVTELRKLGAKVEERESGLSVTGMGIYHAAKLNTYDDHRMAMSLSLSGLKIPGIAIQNPDCVSKTFPDFFKLFLPLIQG